MTEYRQELVNKFTTQLKTECEKNINSLNEDIEFVLEINTETPIETLQQLFNKRLLYLYIIEDFIKDKRIYTSQYKTDVYEVTDETLELLIKREVSTSDDLLAGYDIVNYYNHLEVKRFNNILSAFETLVLKNKDKEI